MDLSTLANKFSFELNSLYHKEEAEAIFLITVQHFLHLKRADYLLRKHQLIAEQDLNGMLKVLDRLATGEPIQYILGETSFYGLTFKVNPSVLIPRSETEELVEWIIEKAPLFSVQSVLDIGTGSGCIAISLKKNLPSATVYALDISEASLTTAADNAILNGVEINFIHDDILKTRLLPTEATYSIIVSNPPYIKMDEKPAMHQNVLANEPHHALFVSDEKPLIFYEAIADFALLALEKGGLLFFEINEYLGTATVSLLREKGFEQIELRKDMQGKDRMIGCRKN